MFTLRQFHPFSLYATGKVESSGDSHFLRISSNVLWIISTKEPDKGKRRVYSRRGLHEYEMDSQEIEEFKFHLESSKIFQKNRKEKLKMIKAPLSETQVVDFKSHEAITVLQHEYAIAQASSDQPVLGTFGADSCVILALYDNKTKTAILAHIDAATDLNSLPDIFHCLSTKHTVAHLAGGDVFTQDMCLDLVELLEKQNIKIVNADIVRTSSAAASLAIDSRTGNIYSPIGDLQLSKTSDFDKRLILCAMQFCNSPLKEVKAASTTNPESKQTPIEKINKDTEELIAIVLDTLSKGPSISVATKSSDNQTNENPNHVGYGLKK